jgi:hypothetical protein
LVIRNEFAVKLLLPLWKDRVLMRGGWID